MMWYHYQSYLLFFKYKIKRNYYCKNCQDPRFFQIPGDPDQFLLCYTCTQNMIASHLEDDLALKLMTPEERSAQQSKWLQEALEKINIISKMYPK